MGVLQSGVVLGVKVVATERFPTAERVAYHTALVALAGEDLGRTLGAWRAKPKPAALSPVGPAKDGAVR